MKNAETNRTAINFKNGINRILKNNGCKERAVVTVKTEKQIYFFFSKDLKPAMLKALAVHFPSCFILKGSVTLYI